MADQQAPEGRHLDDELARFTDELLDAGLDEKSDMAANDEELQQLQQTVLRLTRALGSAQPDETAARRIRANLVEAWRKTHAETPESTGSFFSQLLSSVRLQPRQVYALALLAVILIVGGVVLITSPTSPGGGGLPGAGGGQAGQWPIYLLLGIALAGVLWWFVRQRRS